MAQYPNIEQKSGYLSQENQKKIVISISNMCYSSAKEDDERAWKMMHGNIDFSEYDYLTKLTNPDTGEDYVFPAKLRWIPIQKKNVNSLIGMKSKREFRYQVKSVDKRSLAEKRENQVRSVIDAYIVEINMSLKEMELLERSVNKQIQKLNEQQQQIQQQFQALQEQAKSKNEDICWLT